MNVKAKIKDTSIADEIVIPLTMQPNASFPSECKLAAASPASAFAASAAAHACHA